MRAAYYQNECLAVLVVFRAQGEPFDPSWPLILEAVGPVLSDKIARSIRVYQRGMGDEGHARTRRMGIPTIWRYSTSSQGAADGDG